MGTEISLPAGFGPLPAALAAEAGANDELGAGVSASYAVVGYKGKVWSVKFSGEEKVLMRDDGDGPRNSIDVVLVKANPAISKIFYSQGYVDGSNAAPDCWSADGVKPDGSVQKKVSPTCADCPMNAWGSRTTEAGKQSKACADSRRVAIIPLADMKNELYGGPMLLRVPAASLKDLKAYGDLLKSYQYPYYGAVTRISFDVNEAFPKFVFTAIRALTEPEAAIVAEMRQDKRVGTVLAEHIEPVTYAGTAPAAAAPAVPASPFGVAVGGATTGQAPVATHTAPGPATNSSQTVASPAPVAQATQAPSTVSAPTASPAQSAQPVSEQDAEIAGAPDSFDAMLETLIGN